VNHPPFSNGFVHWEDALDYYARHYYLGNVKIVSTPGSLKNPIPVPSTAPTPVKKRVKKPVGKSAAAPKVVQIETKVPKRKANDVNPTAGPSSAITRIKLRKDQKRARTEPLPEEMVAGKPSYAGKVVDVSDDD